MRRGLVAIIAALLVGGLAGGTIVSVFDGDPTPESRVTTSPPATESPTAPSTPPPLLTARVQEGYRSEVFEASGVWQVLWSGAPRSASLRILTAGDAEVHDLKLDPGEGTIAVAEEGRFYIEVDAPPGTSFRIRVLDPPD